MKNTIHKLPLQVFYGLHERHIIIASSETTQVKPAPLITHMQILQLNSFGLRAVGDFGTIAIRKEWFLLLVGEGSGLFGGLGFLFIVILDPGVKSETGYSDGDARVQHWGRNRAEDDKRAVDS